MVNFINTTTRSLARIAFAFIALFMGVLLISSFTMVNCAWAQDSGDTPYPYIYHPEQIALWPHEWYHGYILVDETLLSLLENYPINGDSYDRGDVNLWIFHLTGNSPFYTRCDNTMPNLRDWTWETTILKLKTTSDIAFSYCDIEAEEIYVNSGNVTVTNSGNTFIAGSLFIENSNGVIAFNNESGCETKSLTINLGGDGADLSAVNHNYYPRENSGEDEIIDDGDGDLDDWDLDGDAGDTGSGEGTVTGGGESLLEEDEEENEGNNNEGNSASNDNSVTLSGLFKVNDINLLNGNVVFETNTTFDALGDGLNYLFGSGEDNSGDDNNPTQDAGAGEGYDEGDGADLDDEDDTPQDSRISLTVGGDVKLTAKSAVTFHTSLDIAIEDDATLKICCEAEGSKICAESVFVSSGRIDILGVLDSILEVGNGAIFSPGNSPGEAAIEPSESDEQYYFTLDSGATLLMEVYGTSSEENDRLIVSDNKSSIQSGSIVKFDWVNSETPVLGQDYEVKMPEINWEEDNVTFSSYYFVAKSYDSARGVQILGVNPNAVPEPSTWALLILGVAGLLYLRKREKNA